MLEKRQARKAPGATTKAPARKDEALAALANRMFVADGKNPYFRGDRTIRNLEELDLDIAGFEHHEAPWVADWLDYLGDAEVAQKLRAEPSHFRRIIHERAGELRDARL